MEAIVLAGGLGTRLRSVVSDRPKPMADLAGKPFLAHILGMLADAGVARTVLSIGYLGDMIADYFGAAYQGMVLEYCHEELPLGTGGALREALKLIRADQVFVLNGDTLCEIDYQAMFAAFSEASADIMIATKYLLNTSRYGTVIIENGVVSGFEERASEPKAGHINVGTYLLRRQAFSLFERAGSFSFEADVLKPSICELRPLTFPVSGYFVDIGVPDDYFEARSHVTR